MAYCFRVRDARHIWLTARCHAQLVVLLSFLMTGILFMSGFGAISGLGVLLALLFVMDAKSRRLPDWLTFPFLLVSLVYAAFTADDVILRVMGALYIGFSLILVAYIGHKRLHVPVLGGGDIKLIPSFPLLIGFFEAMCVLLIACALQVIWMIILRKGVGATLPLGPSLLLSLMMVILWNGLY